MSEGFRFPGGPCHDFGFDGGGGFIVIPMGVMGSLDQAGGDEHYLPYPLVGLQEFPASAWDAGLSAKAVLADNSETSWIRRVEKTLTDPPSSDAALRLEIRSLIADSVLRKERADEIMLQAHNLRLYWMNALGTPAARPATWKLIEAALHVGETVGLYFKNKYKRPRPVQIYPALMPLLLTPPHPSYPNNHALQSLLVARLVGAAVPTLAKPLLFLADRIGHNREIAGLHFPSDRVASAALADALVPIALGGSGFQNLIADVSTEWPHA